tara:strand:- start:141 stop:269 length:129 start_codon:yes stop_codon:yes gene_type:complete
MNIPVKNLSFYNEKIIDLPHTRPVKNISFVTKYGDCSVEINP